MSLEIRHQPGTIGVIAKQHTVIGQFDGIDCPRPFCPWAQPVNQRECLLLERHGDIAALAAPSKEVPQSVGKFIHRRFGQPVLQLLLGLSGKQGVNERGFTVAHRVAKNQITIHQTVPL